MGDQPVPTTRLWSPKRIALTLACVVVALSSAHLTSQGVKYLLKHDSQFGLEPLFYMENEANIPSWFSSALLLLSGGLLAVIGIEKRQRRASYALHWLILAGLFVLLSLDETASLHEKTARLFSSYHLTGFLKYSWVIVGTLFVAVVGLSYLSFLRHLPAATRRLFLLAGGLYIGGAIGMEMLGGHWDSVHGKDNLGYALHVWIEETLEMTGLVVFIYALCRYVQEEIKGIQLDFDHPASPPPDPQRAHAIKEVA